MIVGRIDFLNSCKLRTEKNHLLFDHPSMASQITLNQAKQLLSNHDHLRCEYDICMGDSACLQVQRFQVCVCEDMKYGRFCQFDYTIQNLRNLKPTDFNFLVSAVSILSALMIVCCFLLAYIVRKKTIASMDKRRFDKKRSFRSFSLSPQRWSRESKFPGVGMP